MPSKRPPNRRCSKENCNSWCVRGTLFCRKHIEYEIKRGVNAPHLKHGRYSASLPTDLCRKYDTAIRDGALLELNDEIAVCIARSQQLQEKLTTFESGKAWREIKKQLENYQKAVKEGDAEGMAIAWKAAMQCTEQGVGEAACWSEMEKTFRLHKDLVESQRKRLLELKQYMTLERILILIESLMSAVHESVSDVEVREEIAARFGMIISSTRPKEIEVRAEELDEHFQRQIEGSGVF